MKILKSGSAEFVEELELILSRRERVLDSFGPEIDREIEKYRRDRERVLCEWARVYDGVNLTEDGLWIEEDVIKSSHKKISSEVRKAIDHTRERIERFQEQLKIPSFQTNEESGVSWGTEVRPLDRVGIYVPGGKANYFMTLLLCAVPIQIAGVKEILVATPPKRSLDAPYVDPALLYIAKLFGIPRILVSGSVGAMAAMAFGTTRSKPVDKIVGSGGLRAAVAKMRLSGFVGVEGFSGPAETAFVCDKTSDIPSIAADIIGRADFDPEAGILVFHSQEKWMRDLVEALGEGVQGIKEPQERAAVQSVLEKNTTFFLVKDFDEALERVNQVAPGVVSLAIENPGRFVEKISACGHLLLGPYTTPVGLDLTGGPAGLVSTMGSAHFSVSMSPASFVRRFTSIEFDQGALERSQQESLKLARQEGFLTHEKAFTTRLSPSK